MDTQIKSLRSKVCTKCLIEKPLNEFSKNTRRKGFLKRACISCYNIYSKKYAVDHREEIRIYKWRSHCKNRDKVNKKCRKYHKEYVFLLTDGYIKNLFTKESILTAADIPQELIELKRLQIQLLRLKKSKYNNLIKETHHDKDKIT